MLIELESATQGQGMDVSYSLNKIDDKHVQLSGTVKHEGSPVCAMVLANGQYMFTCSGDGSYTLNVPIDEKGEITLFSFCSGRPPYKEILFVDEEFKPIDTNTADINSAGGIIKLSGGEEATFDAGIVTSNSKIIFNKYDTPLASIGEAEVLSFTYSLEIETKNISDFVGNDLEDSDFLTLEYPPIKSSNSISAFRLTNSLIDDAYSLARTTISNGKEKIVLYSKVAKDSAKQTVKIGKSYLDQAKKIGTSAVIKITTEVLNFIDYFDLKVDSQLF